MNSHEPPLPQVHVKRKAEAVRHQRKFSEFDMASPRTRRVLKEIKPKDGNSVSGIEINNTVCNFVSLLYKNCDHFLCF